MFPNWPKQDDVKGGIIWNCAKFAHNCMTVPNLINRLRQASIPAIITLFTETAVSSDRDVS